MLSARFLSHFSLALLALAVLAPVRADTSSAPASSAPSADTETGRPFSWSKPYRTENGAGNETFQAATALRNGGFIAVGTASRPERRRRNYSDGWIVKIAPNGGVIWQKTVGGEKPDMLTAVAESRDGTILAAGSTYKPDARNSDGYVLVVDKEGETVAEKTYGGEDGDRILSAAAHPDGGFVLAGAYATDSGFFGWTSEGWVIRTDERGEALWTKTFKEFKYNLFNGVTVMSDGGILAVGSGGHNNEREKGAAWLVRLDKDGREVWRHTLERKGPHELLDVMALPGGGSVAVGAIVPIPFFQRGYGLIVRFDDNGNLLWERTIEQRSTTIRAVELGPDGTIAVGANRIGNVAFGGVRLGDDLVQLYGMDGKLLLNRPLGTYGLVSAIMPTDGSRITLFGTTVDRTEEHGLRLSGFGWSGEIPVAQSASGSN